MPRRYPLQALVSASGLSEAALGRKIGLTGTPLIKARELGLVEARADRAAVLCGLTPWLVWPEWLEDAEVECAERSCTNRFVPSRKGHRFCSKRCCNREVQRERFRLLYATDPAFAERERQRRLQGYAECADYERARQRRYRQRKKAAA